MDTRFLHNSKYLYSDNKTIFKTTTGYERYDYSVYVFCDPNEPFNLKVGDVVIPHRPFYIGKGLAFGPVNRWRAYTHTDDALCAVLRANPNKYVCYIVSIGISDIQAKCLEAWLIAKMLDEYGAFLSTYGEYPMKLQKNQILNKKRERKNEKLSKTILKF